MNKARKNALSFPLFPRGRKRGGCRFTLIVAVSLDGRITRGRTEGSEWTSPEDQRWFRRELDRYDAAIMGRKTFETLKRPLTPRNRIVFTRRPIPLTKGGAGDGGCLHALSTSQAKVLSLLKQRGWSRVAVLGGTSIYDWFLKHRLIDELYLTVEPVVFGKGKLFANENLKVSARFILLSVRKLNRQGTLLLHYKRR